MGTVASLTGGVTTVAIAILVWPAAAVAAPGDAPLALEVRPAHSANRAGEPVRLTVSVTNRSDAACGLSKAAEGTVQITSVRRDGQELVPVLTRSFHADGLGGAIRAGMVEVAPGLTVELTLAGVRIAGGDPGSVVLRSVTAAPDGAAMDTLWPIGSPGRYEVTAGYAVPPVEGAITPCVGAAAAQTVSFTMATRAAESFLGRGY